jgi:hypothetical protein
MVRTKKLVDRLRDLCDACLRSPSNRHSGSPVGLEPCCTRCKLLWEAADEIEYLRDSLLEANRRRD